MPGPQGSASGKSCFSLPRRLLGRETGNEYPTSKRLIDRGNQVTIHELFHDIASPSRSNTARQNLSVLMNGEENNLWPVTPLCQRPGDVYAAHTWHRDVQDDKIRFKLQRRIQSSFPVRDQANDIE